MNVDHIQDMVEKDGIIFLSYGGFLTQTLIAGMTEALEKEAEYNDLNIGVSSNIFTIFIELSQNVMNYSKNKSKDCKKVKSEGLIVVGKDQEGNYYIHSQNIIDIEDKERMEPRLEDITTLSRDEIKNKYRELRRSGKDSHGKGGGIGFYEIAKRSSKVSYEFKEINEQKYYFHFISRVNIKKEQ
jgi:hypothetical protein